MALILVLLYIMSNREALYSASSITICFDSMSAIYTSIGRWNSVSMRKITVIAQSLWEACQYMIPVNVHHILSHTGSPINELADSV